MLIEPEEEQFKNGVRSATDTDEKLKLVESTLISAEY